MSERLYYTDSYLRQFTAHVAAHSADGLTVFLDRSAFYPTSGGQPFDTGSICGVAVIEVAEEEDAGTGETRIAHRLAAPLPAEAAGAAVGCAVDWDRRFDHMQQHTGQHLLSAVFADVAGLRTVSFHLGAESSTIDLEGGAVTPAILAEVERRVNQTVFENRTVAIGFEEAGEAEGLRKASGRTGVLRIVSIEGLDRSACGGTHVRATGEIGPVLLRKFEKVRQSTRVEFLCGSRAVARARADYDALLKAAQSFSSTLDEVPGNVAALIESSRAAAKSRRKLELELAGYQGKELYEATAPRPDGVRRVARRMESGNVEDLRAIATSFTAQPRAVFLATLSAPPSVLLAASEDAGVDAGKQLKAALAAAGGRGGGTARMAQGSVPDAALLDSVTAKLEIG